MLALGWPVCAEARPLRSDQASTTLNSIDWAITLYRINHAGEPPPEEHWFERLHLLPFVSRDPWTRPYVYCRTGGEKYIVLSLGHDGIFGTPDDQLRGDVENTAACRSRVPQLSWWDELEISVSEFLDGLFFGWML